MYFKSLELIGFKSFAEKTALNFEPGVTAIVGPNGCGKSNIADAIRWVLGEQSAKSLRASNMQDVIFNGTDTKEPINFAEVSLTFSNENRALPIDYDEVTISRRVFRSGETEYLLNKTPVRLKDISELLMGTGIGTESYSIIEQGKMDLILSSKPEDRRYVFEEASGITKYKSKKKEALRKLEQTEQNLLRINDIILEVKRQISSIERQARKAERYKVDFDKLKDLETKLSSCEYKDLRTQEATHAVENADAKSREKELDAEIKEMASRISLDRQKLDEISSGISDLRHKSGEAANAIEMNKHKIEIDRERIEESASLQKSLKEEVASVTEKITSARALVAKLKGELDNAATARSDKEKAILDKDTFLNNLSKEIDDIDLKVKACKVHTVDYLAKETRFKNELIKLGADVQNRKARERRLVLEKESVGKELETVTNTLSEALKEFRVIEESVAGLRSSLDSKKNAAANLAAEIKSAEENIAKEDNKKAVLKSKIELLEDSLKRHEGFNRGVKSLLSVMDKGNGSFGGVVGVLADMIKVERGYEEAVSTLLGDDAQVIVTENDSDIIKVIDYLKANSLGKAGFISMQTLNRAAGDPKQASAAAGLVPLKNFVKIEKPFEALVDHFFHNAYLAGSSEDCLKNSNAHGAMRFVTKTGDMFDNYKISGGSASDNDESILVGRLDRLEDFKTELKRSEEVMARAITGRDKLKESAVILQAELGRAEESLHKEDINLANAKMKKDGQEESANKLKSEVALLSSELEETIQELSELTSKGESINGELNNLEKEKTEAQAFIDESQTLVAERRRESQRATIEVTTLKAELQSLSREEESARSNLKGQEAFLFELEDTIYAKSNLLKESADKVKLFDEEITKLTAENESASTALRALNEEFAKLESARSAITGKLGGDEAGLKSKEGVVESLRNQIRDLDVKLTELNYKKTNLRDRILQSYKVDMENTHIETEENIDWDTLKNQVTELKDRIEKLGSVNLVAIDEHKELEERHAFLVHQQEDLVAAKDSLMKAIQKINKTTKDLFLETFQKIQVEFKNFFRLLFGGGQAELVLIDEQDILESGIEIIVRPPGKKLQNLMLMSGGEKALTAIALLFSIFKVKPSPFCVLDEIDAPLDESNVSRFSNVLKDFLKMSQFIIITHNKRTIELADVMYGITMQERGVSKIVSVKFLDGKKTEEKKTEEKAGDVPEPIAA